jgi:hypothetical protein
MKKCAHITNLHGMTSLLYGPRNTGPIFSLLVTFSNKELASSAIKHGKGLHYVREMKAAKTL